MSTKPFTEFGFSAPVLKAIARLGFEQPAPIQAEAFPHLLSGSDLVGQSQTGSGKTAAFAIPAVEKLDPAERSVQVLILCPTRELAIQVSEEVHKIAYFKTGVRPLPIYGGQSYDRQLSGLRAGANIVIGTPGRVMDHMNRGTLRLEKVKMVILDEADEMLNMGFRDDIEFILKAVPTERQTVLFSATVPKAIEELIRRYTKTPVRIHIEAKALTVPTVEQVYVEVERRGKIDALERLIDMHNVTRGIVFCNTQRMVDDLTEHMNAAGYGADCIHGGMAQGARDRVMKKFRSGGIEFLVATDVAARGIDVDDIQAVFNYDLPYDGEDYVHRIGRTGRAGRSGLAISFVSGREVFMIRQIERYTRHRMHRAEVPSEGEIEEARVGALVEKVRGTIKAGDFRHYDRIIETLLEEGVNSMDLSNALFHLLSRATAAGAASEADAEKTARMAAFGPPAEKPLPTSSSSDRAPRSQGPRPELPPRASANRPDRPDRPWDRKPVRDERNFRSPQDRPAPRPDRPDRADRPAPRPEARPAIRPDTRPPAGPRSEEKPDRPPSRKTPDSMSRVWLGVGKLDGISPGDIKGCILGESGAPTEAVGYIDLREKHSFVDIESSQVSMILPKLNRAHLGGRKLKAKLA